MYSRIACNQTPRGPQKIVRFNWYFGLSDVNYKENMDDGTLKHVRINQ